MVQRSKRASSQVFLDVAKSGQETVVCELRSVLVPIP